MRRVNARKARRPGAPGPAAGAASRIPARIPMGVLACEPMRRYLALLPLALLAVCGARRAAAQIDSSYPHAAITLTCASFRDSTGQPLAEVALELAPGDLSFVKDGNGYRCEVDIAVSLFDEHDDLRGGDVWRRTLRVSRYRDLERPGPVLQERRTFPVAPGRYLVRVEVHDLEADRTRTAEQPLVVEGVPPAGRSDRTTLQLSDLQLGALADSIAPPHHGSIVPALALTFGNPLPRVACYGEAYVGGAGPDTVSLSAQVLDESEHPLLDVSGVARVRAGVAPFLLRPPLEQLGVGGYILEVQARWGKEKARRELRFEMDETRIVFDRNFDEVLEMLALVVGGEELDSLRHCPVAERPAMWDRFWSRHNPEPGGKGNPAEREFFRRVRYASQHFATSGSGPGWRTDMGRVYIKYGPPEETERHPRTATDPAVEIWYYSEPLRMTFVFADRVGFGRYELVSQR